MFFVIIIAILYFVLPKTTGVLIISPIAGFLAGSTFWGFTALCTNSVHSLSSYLAFIMITTIISMILVFVDD
jgi:hypothetical protein